jgi:hypothetical protein
LTKSRVSFTSNNRFDPYFQAAHDVLLALVPAGQDAFDTALKSSLENISDARRDSGRKVGARVANRTLAWRSNDGFADANLQPPAFLPPLLPATMLFSRAGRTDVSGPLLSHLGRRTALNLPLGPPPQKN